MAISHTPTSTTSTPIDVLQALDLQARYAAEPVLYEAARESHSDAQSIVWAYGPDDPRSNDADRAADELLDAYLELQASLPGPPEEA